MFMIKKLISTLTGRGQDGSTTLTINPPNLSDLPKDLLLMIISRLLLIDRIRFRATSPIWTLPIYPCRDKDLPWVVGHTWCTTKGQKRVKFTVFEPYQLTHYAVNELTIRNKRTCMGAQILASKYGWLFLVLRGSTPHVLTFVLFSPLTKKTIELPDLLWDGNHNTCVGTFSSNPITSDCVFFVVLTYFESSKICMYRPGMCGKSEWTTQRSSEVYIRSVEFIGEYFCCLTCTGNLIRYRLDCALSTYYILRQQHRLHHPVHSPRLLQAEVAHLIDYNGDILKVAYTHTTYKELSYKVFRLKNLWSKPSWEQLDLFPDLTIFFDHSTSFIVPATGSRNHMANKIFYYDYDGKCKIYSFEDKRTHMWKDDRPYYGWCFEKECKPTWFRPSLPPCYHPTKKIQGDNWEGNSINSMDL